MQSLRNSRDSRRINQVYSLGCFPGSFAFRRPVRSIVNEKIANVRFITKAKSKEDTRRRSLPSTFPSPTNKPWLNM